MNTPVLYLIFNRPTETELSFSRIRQVKPSILYIAADGPRSEKIGEYEKCQQARAITEIIDWPCEVKRLYRDENLGCGKAVSEAITWFFKYVDEGIILEDDCVPDMSFFSFCTQLLEKYREDKSIMHIGGTCSTSERPTLETDYFFSAYNHIWGWATWRRAWELYSFEITEVPEFKKSDALKLYFDDEIIRIQWYTFLEGFNIDTWDFQWTYTIWKNQGISILPKVNLIQNIGFNPDAVHTKNDQSIFAGYTAHELQIKNHPTHIHLDKYADKRMSTNIFYMISENCPLTGSSNLEVIKRIKTSWLIEAYRNTFSIDISAYFKDLDYISLVLSKESGYRYFYPYQLGGNDQFYQHLQTFPWYYMPWKWEHEVAVKYIPKGSRVLEIGCAKGAFMQKAQKLTDSSFVGLELNTAAFNSAIQAGLTVYNETVEQHALKAQPYDVVCSFQVLEHIDSVKSFLGDSISILKNGGKLIIGVPNSDSFTKEDVDYDILNMPPHHMGWWNKASLEYVAKLFDLEVVSIKNEPLQKQHVDWYIRNLGIRMKRHPKANFIYQKLRVAKIAKLLLPIFSPYISGHSIIAIYRKK